MNTFSLQNIVQGNGIAISITGMAIVFSGLIIMSIFIKLLPSIINLLERKADTAESSDAKEEIEAPDAKQEAAAAPVESTADTEDQDIASVIGLILHLENERLYQSNPQYITINRDPSQQSRWGRTGQMRETPNRRSYAKV